MFLNFINAENITDVAMVVVMILSGVLILVGGYKVFIQKKSLSDIINLDPLLLCEGLLVATTVSETLNLISIGTAHNLSGAIFRYSVPVLGEMFFSFFFIRILSQIFADGKLEWKEAGWAVAGLAFFCLATLCTYSIYMSYLESVGAITWYSSVDNIFFPRIEVQEVIINRAVFWNIWCTPILNIVALFLSALKKKWGDIQSDNKSQKQKKKSNIDDIHNKINNKGKKEDNNNEISKKIKSLWSDIEKLTNDIDSNPNAPSVNIKRKTIEQKQKEIDKLTELLDNGKK